jgi:hypothetical protein
MKLQRLVSLAMAAACSAAAAQSSTQTWDYKSYMKDPASGTYSKERFRTSTVTVAEKDGKATFRMITPGRGDPCISNVLLPAEVVRTPEITQVTVKPELSGCEPFRYLIRNDGSGGVRQHLRGEQWKDDGFDHGLTPAK